MQMTEISPAAKTVLDAINKEFDEAPWDLTFIAGSAAAAALRTAVNEVAPEKTIEDIDYVHQSYVDGYKDALYEILNLVDELEAQ